MLTLDAIRPALEGAIPSALATCAPDGTPNITYVSQVHYVDAEHVALSYQFFNKTRRNVLATRRATALVIHPATAAQYRLDLDYLSTRTEGALFENMKAHLAGIASHTGMSGVFRLLGADLYRVRAIRAVPGRPVAEPPPRRNPLPALRVCAERLGAATDLGGLLETALEALDLQLDIRHAIVLMVDRAGRRLFTVASRGYAASGVGSEVALGCGVIGVAAEQRAPIRISHMTAEYSYARAIRDSLERAGLAGSLETAIPFPGLSDSRSQLAAPIVAAGHVAGVLYVESPEDLRFSYDDEDAVVTLAAHLGAAIHALQQGGDEREAEAGTGRAAAPRRAATATGPAVAVRHYRADDSVFVDDDYLIKGVAGAIFWKLLRTHAGEGRVDFSNRELRLDPTLGLPDISDNLEARLILLERRLAERAVPLRIEKTGRGRFRLRIDRPFTLADVPA